MINKSLFRQIGIFFGVPLVLAIIHSIFGIQFAMKMMSGLASEKRFITISCRYSSYYRSYIRLPTLEVKILRRNSMFGIFKIFLGICNIKYALQF